MRLHNQIVSSNSFVYNIPTQDNYPTPKTCHSIHNSNQFRKKLRKQTRYITDTWKSFEEEKNVKNVSHLFLYLPPKAFPF